MLVLILIAVAIVGSFVLYGTAVISGSAPYPLDKITSAGAFGDSFGILTSLFSGLAFAGIIATVWMQRKELQLQRKELELTREELRATREEMKSQHSTAKLQNFESTFFQMLRLHNEIVDSIDLVNKSTGIRTSGRDCFSTFYSRLRSNYNEHKKGASQKDEAAIISMTYTSFWKYHQSELGHYFRYLYTIFRFIKENDFVDRKFYSRIVRAQLSDQELLVLFYNCLYKYGVQKFKPLVEEFEVFDNLPQDLLLNNEHTKLFVSKAFGSI